MALRRCRSGALEGWRGPDKGDFEWQPLWPTLLILKADTCLPSLASFSHLPCPTSGKGRGWALFVPISLFVTLRGSRGADLAARPQALQRQGRHAPPTRGSGKTIQKLLVRNDFLNVRDFREQVFFKDTAFLHAEWVRDGKLRLGVSSVAP